MKKDKGASALAEAIGQNVEEEGKNDDLGTLIAQDVNIFGSLSAGDYAALSGSAGFFLTKHDQDIVKEIATISKDKGYTMNVIPISRLSPESQTAAKGSLRTALVNELNKYCTLREAPTKRGKRVAFNWMPARTFTRGNIEYSVLGKGGYKFQPANWIEESDTTDLGEIVVNL